MLLLKQTGTLIYLLNADLVVIITVFVYLSNLVYSTHKMCILVSIQLPSLCTDFPNIWSRDGTKYSHCYIKSDTFAAHPRASKTEVTIGIKWEGEPICLYSYFLKILSGCHNSDQGNMACMIELHYNFGHVNRRSARNKIL